MKIGFFGTPEIAGFCLEKLSQQFTITFVVTGEDKPGGRKLKLLQSPVKKIAIEKGIKIFQPSNLLDADFIESIKDTGADIFVVVAYGRIIPPQVFNIPPYKTINLHPSLLPAYRGAAPINWVLINGENETGITIQLIDSGCDTGDVLAREKILLNNDISAGELYEIVLERGPEIMISTINKISSEGIEPVKQDEKSATYCGKIDRDFSRIDWTDTPGNIHNKVRGLSPVPSAWTTFRGKNIKVQRTAIFHEELPEGPGQGNIYIYNKKRLLIGCNDNFLEILKLQPETSKIMEAISFINGYRIEKGECFI